VAKVNVYLTDMAAFAAMNEAYSSVFGDDPPARITVGCTALALGASVEMDCVAFIPDSAEGAAGADVSDSTDTAGGADVSDRAGGADRAR